MLILTRRLNEKLRINENIVISIEGIRNNQVRIGIDAPKDVSIWRDELPANRRRKPDSQSPNDSSK